ncbi:DNA polymerase III subunit [Altibacter sp. HG106]|uniref:DNA polymerase III subunit n=1 Tax=Altibacter sp. HG106 TaxID=3023937 RepID=UPI002350CFB7|nr:DNA polymerase III subunit delta' [Altibacter sp. HG106]MDC7994989.1 DNA polymerase III subunit delta' [Altibacter sp. HG106]
MDYSAVIGQHHIKSHLQTSIAHGRIPHAQLFVGASGVGVLPMAMAYAKELLCAHHSQGSVAHQKCAEKVEKLSHPDLHFVYPINKNEKVKKHWLSSHFLEEWRDFVMQHPYGSLFEWLQMLGIENKQGIINVDEAAEMMKKLSLKSYEGGVKVMIIWMADKMNLESANKTLKLIEEPPDKTVLILITENEEDILPTIYSRCQKITFPLLAEADLQLALQEKVRLEAALAQKIAHRAQGNYHNALRLLDEAGEDAHFEQWFVAWVRTAFKAKGNKKAINELLHWSDQMAGLGRETQKKFLSYCLELFRQALLENYSVNELVYFEPISEPFSLAKFAPFVHQNNIFDISEALNHAIYHVSRNGNGKIIFSDLSIQLTRFIHRKP